MTYAIGSLFSGIGGLELGVCLALAELGHAHRIAWQVEADPFCVEVLAQHWPHVPRHRDVRAVRFDRLERPDIMCGGFPCQDVSQAGKQAGITGARSGLWSEYVRAVRDLRPRLVFVENVRGLVPHLGAVLGPLAELGYDAQWTMLRASDIGAPHERARIFLLAYAHGARPQGGDHLPIGEGRARPDDRDPTRGEELADAGHDRRERSSPIDGARRALAIEQRDDVDRCDPHRRRRRSHPAASRVRRGLDGLPLGLDRSPPWPARPDEPPGVNEPPRATRAPIHDCGERLHALGNAVVPQQAAAAFLHLYQRINE